MPSQIRNLWIVCLVLAALGALSVWTLTPFTKDIQFLPDEGFNWYYWKLPEPTFWSRATSWGGYLLHQIFIFGAIIWAKKNRDQLTNWNALHPLNYVILGGTAFFVALHYLQTMFFFDGLGQDVDVAWSQGSVVVMLVIILVMEAPRRGLFFTKGKPWFKDAQGFLYRNHGYYIAWAVTFTFWYHPMYPTWGHVSGFFYMYLIFIQQGFVFTRMHVEPRWNFVIETTVVLHGVVMALTSGNHMWGMFGFGFAALVIITQMWGIPISKRTRWGFAAAYVIGVVISYSYLGWDRLDEIIRIPVIEYLGAIILGFTLVWLIRRKQSAKVAEQGK